LKIQQIQCINREVNLKNKYIKFTLIETNVFYHIDIYLRKDGNPDLRHKENRVHLVALDGTILKKDGTPDMRVKENKQKFGVKQKF